MAKLFSLVFVYVFLAGPAASGAAENLENAREKHVFSGFSASLPDGWTGFERKGFVSRNPAEYMLVIGKKDAHDEKFLSQISVYMFPNQNSEEAGVFAEKMSRRQGGASEPIFKDGFWVFTGEPRTRAVEGEATFMVNASPEKVLVIIYQDAQNLGAREIVDSLRGENPEAKQLLGR